MYLIHISITRPAVLSGDVVLHLSDRAGQFAAAVQHDNIARIASDSVEFLHCFIRAKRAITTLINTNYKHYEAESRANDKRW